MNPVDHKCRVSDCDCAAYSDNLDLVSKDEIREGGLNVKAEAVREKGLRGALGFPSSCCPLAAVPRPCRVSSLP